MKKYLYLFVIAAIVTLGLSAYKYSKDAAHYKAEYIRMADNNKAYELQNSNLEEQNRVFQFTMDELRNSKDSINQKLLAMAEKLKIKDKNIQALQYQATEMRKTDTITIKGDTIFRDIYVNVDTTFGDKWYSMNLKLKYPSTIITAPIFKSERYVVINTTKEYNKPPSKIFFIRWFQKKHTVIKVNVVEENPYVDNKEQKFVEIVK